MKQQFEELLKEWGPKHWSFGLRKNPELLAWIHEQTHDLPEGVPLPERVLCAITGERALCSRGKTRKFKSIIDGWGFCGRAGKCECAHEQIARKVSASKQSLSDEERDAIQFKREQTNLIRYGHINTGQTEAARAAHKAFYSDLENVRNQLRKQVATMMARYGVENAAHLRILSLNARPRPSNATVHAIQCKMLLFVRSQLPRASLMDTATITIGGTTTDWLFACLKIMVSNCL